MTNVGKTALIITALTLGSKIVAFMRQIALAHFYGTSCVIDAYVMAMAIPGIVFGWITSLEIAYTPMYLDARMKFGEDRAVGFTNHILSIGSTISIVCALIGVVFSSQLVRIVAPGFAGDVYMLTSRFLSIYMVSIAVNVFVQILVAYLNCNHQFIVPGFAVFAVNGMQVVFALMSSKFGKDLLIYGALLANVVQLLILYLFSGRNGYRFRYALKVTPEIKQALTMWIPLLISGMVGQLNGFVQTVFASGLIEGSVSALSYALSIRIFIHGVFSATVTTIMYPMLSESVAENDMDAFREIVSKAVNVIIILFIPITVGVLLLSEPVMFLVYGRGAFSAESTAMTSVALRMYSLGLFATCLTDVFTKVLHAMKDTRTTLYLNAFTVAACITASAILVKLVQHAGLALAGSLAEIMALPLFLVLLKRRIGDFGMKNSFRILVTSCTCSGVMGTLVYSTYRYFSFVLGLGKPYMLLSLVIASAAGGLAYFALMTVMKVKEMDFFAGILRGMYRKVSGLIKVS